MIDREFDVRAYDQGFRDGRAEAAAEIERLRAEKEAAGKLSAFINLRADMFEAKSAKLRTALCLIAEHPVEQSGQWEVGAREMLKLARAALGGDK